MDPSHPFLTDADADKLVEPSDLKSLYPKLIGELLYLSVCTRPDISLTVQRLSQYLSCPSARLLAAAKRVLRYLVGTLNYRLHYGERTCSPLLHGFSDADWATNPEDRISVTGYCWFYYGGVVAHTSKKQTTQALSSTEAEYMAVTAAIQEGLWIQSFLSSVGFPVPTPIRLYADNAGAIALSWEAANNHRTKHINIRYHFCRTHVEAGTFLLEWLASSRNTADVLTKALPCPSFSRHVAGLSLVSR